MDAQRKILPVIQPSNMLDCEKQEAIDRENEDLVQLWCGNCSDRRRCMMEGGRFGE